MRRTTRRRTAETRAGVGRALALAAMALAGCISEHREVYGYARKDAPPSVPIQPTVAPDPGPVTAAGANFNRLVMMFGYRGYDSSWDPFDDQFAFQFGGTHEWVDAPVGLEWAFGFASESRTISGFRYTNQNFELSLGPTKTFHLGGGRWFANVGLGLAWTWTQEGDTTYCCSSVGPDDGWFAGYGHANVFYRVSPTWDIGIDARYLTGEDVDLDGFVLDGQYWQLALTFGFGI